MRKLILAAVFLAVAVAGYSQQKNFIDENYIEVAGYSKMEVDPDMIFISFTIDEADTKLKSSIEQQEKKVIAALTKIGVNVKTQLTINNLSSEFVKYILKKQQVSQMRSYTLEVKDANAASMVFAALAGEGISNANISKVDHSDMENLRIKCRAEAMNNAKARASADVKALGGKIGRAIYAQDLDRSYRNNSSYDGVMLAKAMSSEGAAAQTELEFKKIPVEANVIVYFQMIF